MYVKGNRSKSKNSLYQSYGKSIGDHSADLKKPRSNSRKPRNFVVPGVYLRKDLARPQLKPMENTKQRTFFKKYMMPNKKDTQKLGDLLSINGSSDMHHVDMVSESQFSRSYAQHKAKQAA